MIQVKLLILILFFLTLTYLNPSNLVLAHVGDPKTIKILEDKFEPDELTINKDQTVIFLNADKIDHWPASDLHPTHQIYKEFDPKQPIKPGKSWQFKFERTGSFKFHDHLNPHVVGKITVNEATISSSSKPSKVQPITWPKLNLNLKGNLAEAYFLRVYYFIFPKKLIPKLQQIDALRLAQDENQLKYWLVILGGDQFMKKLILDTDGGSTVDCHQEAHQVGRTAFEIYQSSAFKTINYSCHSGYIHGALEAFIKQQNHKNIIPRLESLCGSFDTNFSKFECFHGIGHGLTAYNNYDLPQTLNYCYQLSSDYNRRSCFGGAFMENIMVAAGRGAVKGHQTNWVNSDPHFPCNSVDQSEIVQFECYQMQTSRMIELFGFNFLTVSGECQRAPSNMISVCFRSMGRDIAGQVLRDPDKIINVCQSTSPPTYFQDCLKGALNVIVDFWGKNLVDQPQALCNKLPSSRDKSFCFQFLGERLIDIFGNDKAKIDSICKLADSAFYQVCLSSLYKNNKFDPNTKSEVSASQTSLTSAEFVKLAPDKQFEYIRSLAGQKSLQQTWQFIQTSYSADIGAGNGPAHDLAHLMGELIFDKANFSGISICNPTFAFGCYHGFLDKAFLKGTENLNQAEQACGSVGPINSGPFGSCIHGIGHGLASYHQTKDLKASLQECDRLTNGQMFCYDGVFMEFERSAPQSFYNANDYLFPCSLVEEKYQLSCGRNQPQVLIHRFNQSFDQVISICSNSTNDNFKQACFDSLGFLTVMMAQGEPQKIINFCQNSQISDFQSRCLKAAAGEIVFENISSWSEKSKQVCQALENENLKKDCFAYSNQLALDYGRK